MAGTISPQSQAAAVSSRPRDRGNASAPANTPEPHGADAYAPGSEEAGLMPRPQGFWSKLGHGLMSGLAALPPLHFDRQGSPYVESSSGAYKFNGTYCSPGGFCTDGSVLPGR